MKRKIPQGFRRKGISINPLLFENDAHNVISVHILDHHLVRVQHHPPLAPVLSVTHTIDPVTLESKNSNVQGIPNSRIHERFPCPKPIPITSDEDTIIYETKTLKIVISLANQDFKIQWYTKTHKTPFVQDLPFRAYEYDQNGGVSHYLASTSQMLYFGLGERASPLNLSGRHFRLSCVDALGYDPERSDPLYKHVPSYIALNKITKEAYGIFYDSLSTGHIDFGCEIDALWGPFTVFRQDHGTLDYYLYYGPSVQSCVETLANLIGFPALPPKYALGYLASSMGYAEASNAQELIENFPQLCRQWDIPCDLLHLSSGYTSIYFYLEN